MAEYWLNRTSGADGNNGTTINTPWQNISKIASGLVSGDIVNLNRGDIWQRSATLNLVAGVTYRAYGTGAMPIIEGADLWAGAWVLQAGSVFKQTGVTTVDSASGMLWEDGVKGVRQTLLASVTAPGMYFLDDAADTLYYWSRTGVGGDPTGRRINLANNNTPFQMNGNGGTIQNIWFRYAAGTAVLTNHFGGGAQTGWLLDGIRVSGGRIHGCDQFGTSSDSSITIQNSEFDGNGDSATNGYGCIWNDVINSLFLNLNVHDNRRGLNVSSTNATTSANIIRNCQAYNMEEDGIAISTGGKDDLIDNCVAYNNGLTVADRTGIKSFGVRTTIQYCTSFNNNVAFKASNPSGHGFQLDFGASSCLIHHCVAYGNAFGGVSLTGTGHSVYHCVGVANHRNGFNVFGGVVSNLKVKNCIWANNGDAAIADAAATRSAFYDNGNQLTASTGVVVDYNEYQNFSGGGSFLVTWAGASYATFAAFRVGVPSQESHGSEADPLFVNTSTPDYHLQLTSPAIDAGIAIAGINDGYAGTAPDKGAFETAATSHGTANSPSNGVRRHRRWYGLYARMLD